MLNPISKHIGSTNRRCGRGDNPHPLRSPGTKSEGLVLEGGADEKLILLLGFEKNVTTSGEKSPAEEGATDRENWYQSRGTGRLGTATTHLIIKENPQSGSEK